MVADWITPRESTHTSHNYWQQLTWRSISSCHCITTLSNSKKKLTIPTIEITNRRKREAREAHKSSQFAQKVTGLRAKMYNKKRHSEKIQMKKTYVSLFLVISFFIYVWRMQQKRIIIRNSFWEAFEMDTKGGHSLFVAAVYLIDCAATQMNWIQGRPKRKVKGPGYFSLIEHGQEYQRKGRHQNTWARTMLTDLTATTCPRTTREKRKLNLQETELSIG